MRDKIKKAQYDKILIKNKRKEVKQKAVEYLGGECKHCGLVTNYYSVYDFHHLDPNAKEFSISKISTRKWETIQKELNKCILLCSNCHRIVHERNNNNGN